MKVSLSNTFKCSNNATIYFLSTVDSAEEHKCMVRLMKMALGYSEKAAEALLSPCKNGTSVASEEPVEEEIIYENEEYLIEELLE